MNQNVNKLSSAAAEYPDLETIDCFSCWKYNEHLQPNKIQINNPKYCQLYPKYARKDLKVVVPNFGHCQTLYTKWDYRLEKCAHEIILKLEDKIKFHSKLLEDELKLQNELVDDMWTSCQRGLILVRGGVCVKLYPEIISEPIERRALRCFYRNLKKVNESNHRLSKSLDDVRTTMAELERRCTRLDNTVKSPFLIGVYYLKPLHYIRVIMRDLCQYFYQHLCKLKSWAELLNPGDLAAIEDYMVVIKPYKDLENNLLEYTENCHCMRSKRTECIQGAIPC